MKNISNYTVAILSFILVALLGSCTAIEGIFKAGMWTGIIFVVVIIAIIIWVISRVTRK